MSIFKCLVNCSAKQRKFRIIYEAGREKVEKDFDFLKIIKDIKYLKMLTRYIMKPQEELKIQIAHCGKNIIDLDKILEENGMKKCNLEKVETKEDSITKDIRPSYYHQHKHSAKNEVDRFLI